MRAIVARRVVKAALIGASTLSLLPLHAGSRVSPVASYRIDATLDETHRITATETVTFVNRTRRSFSDLKLHLYLNAFRSDRSTWLREEDQGGGRDRKHGENERWFAYSEINRISLADGTDLTPGLSYVSPDDGNPDDKTVVSVALPNAVEPGGTLVFRVDFVAKLPRIIERTGVKDDFVLGGQWFPKLGVATDAGWNCHQFHAPTEFFADFGDYDVTLTLAAENKGKVGGTGVLKEEADLPGGRIRVRFTAEDVHDFAFTACPRYVVVRDSFTYKGLPNVEIVLLLQPDHRSARDRYIKAAKEGLAHYGTWYVPYPYPVLTVVDPPYGSHADGMEYPTFIVGGAPWPASVAERDPEDVTVHEFGHQVFYGMLASNEFEEAHLDEGFNTYATYKTMKAVWGDPVLVKRFFGLPFTFDSVAIPYPVYQRRRFYEWQLRSRSDPTVGTTFRTLDGPAAIQNAYAKTAILLTSCERELGEETWARVMKTYTTRWAFRHPTTADFRAVVKEVAGESADALFRETWDSTGSIDYAVSVATSSRVEPAVGYAGDGSAFKFSPAPKNAPKTGPFESVVVVRRLGDAVWPVDVEMRFRGGQKLRRRWDGRERWIRYRVAGPELEEAVVDPDRKVLLDVDLLNNGRRVEKEPAPAARWGHRLRFFAQNVLSLFALLGAAI